MSHTPISCSHVSLGAEEQAMGQASLLRDPFPLPGREEQKSSPKVPNIYIWRQAMLFATSTSTSTINIWPSITLITLNNQPPKNKYMNISLCKVTVSETAWPVKPKAKAERSKAK